jgi:transcriptional regulator with XRE-family HTH domain
MNTEIKLENIRRNSSVDAPTLLKEELSRRIRSNPRYSLRAFAKALKMSPATLSLILAGKYNLSKKGLRQISEVLSLEPAQVEYLEKKLKRKNKENESRESCEGNYKYITLDIFSVISDWYHYAILHLLETPNSSIDPQWKSLVLCRWITQGPRTRKIPWP